MSERNPIRLMVPKSGLLQTQPEPCAAPRPLLEGISLESLLRGPAGANLQAIAQHMQAETGTAGTAIALKIDDAFTCVASSGLVAPPTGSNITANRGLSGVCIRTQQIQLCTDTEQDARVDAEVCRRLGVQSLLMVPIQQNSVMIGLLAAFSETTDGFDSEAVAAISAVPECVLQILRVRYEQPARPPLTEFELSDTTRVADPVAYNHAEPELLAEQGPLDQVTASIAEPESLSETKPETEPPAETDDYRVSTFAEIDAETLSAKVSKDSKSRVLQLVLLLLTSVAVLLALGRMGLLSSNPLARSPHRSTQAIAESGGGFTMSHAPAVTPPAQIAPTQDALTMAAKPTALKQTTADSGPPSVLGMELDPQSGYSRIRVHMSRPANFDSHMLKNPDRLYIDIFDAQVANQLARKDWGIRDVRIRDVRLGKQGETGTRIVFDLTQPVLYSVLHDLHRSELIIELRDLPTKK